MRPSAGGIRVMWRRAHLDALAIEGGAECLQVRLDFGDYHANKIIVSHGEERLDNIVGERVV